MSASAQAPAGPSAGEQAVAWYVRMCSGEASPADERGLQEWLERSPSHRSAWARMVSIQDTLGQAGGATAAKALRAARAGRRQVLRSLGLVVAGAPVAYLAWQVADGRFLGDSTYRTAVGERRSVELPDGSRLVLNTDSAVEVAFDMSQRRILLQRGEVLVETARHRAPAAAGDARPLAVVTAQGQARALGTRFLVRQQGPVTRVTVLDDAVEIRPAGAAQPPLRLQAGQQTVFTREAAEAAQAASPFAGAWERGSLVVEDGRLDTVLAELARYRPGYLACDPRIASRRVSGAFPIDDTDKALNVMARSTGARIRRLTRYWVTLAPD